MDPRAGISQTSRPSILDAARCLGCAQPLRGDDRCLTCGRDYPIRDGILEAIGPLSGRNQIVANFYDGPGWVKFRPWEQAFLMFQGGKRRARMEILRHVVGTNASARSREGEPLCEPHQHPARTEPRPLRIMQGHLEPEAPAVLEVGVGSGENVPFLPPDWNLYGVDIARAQLLECQRKHPKTAGRLAWAEAENLPFDDATFDACWSIGGFNYYSDHEAALREMRRVTKPGGPVVVADESPSLHRAGLGHLLGIPSLDAWWLRKLGLDREFVEMVLAFDVDLTTLFRKVWPSATRHRIWHSLGYCVVEQSVAS
jgi:SAM-dependent methyltransferase